MANTVAPLKFFRQIVRTPPLIRLGCPLSSEVIQVLDVIHSMTRHLSCISSFGERFAIVEPVWARIWQWLAALLKPLDTLTDVQPVVNDLSLDPTSRCMLTVFSFLNSIASPTRATLVELGNFTKKLAAQHNATSNRVPIINAHIKTGQETVLSFAAGV
ncbi:hypothetical protein LENED_006444 [Lentinula edodes]|uniref:Uncharacterized protein n=1 Tax=Lentinula edodes TaxID=5353 RepID=A0A1Q3EBX8_LENED|nr:hypothetical protein LENED_006444 [Lentinula edodes]